MGAIQETNYHDFADRAIAKAKDGRMPVEAVFELTFRCVLKCKHCYTACNQYADQEMTAVEWCRLIDEAADLGTIELLITGGDPMLRGDVFKKVYTHAKKRGLWITVYTSGNLIHEKWAQFFAKNPPFLIEITLYGATEATYEKVTQVKGSFKRCMEGIEWLEKYKVPFKLKTVIPDINKNEVHACKKISISHGQKDFRIDAALHPKLNGSDIPLSHRLTPKEVLEFDMADEQRKKDFEKQFQRPLKARLPEEVRNFHCGAGQANFFCNPYGKLQVCTIVPGKEYQYDWKNGGNLKEAFYEFFPTITNTRPKRPQRCHPCNLWDVCDMCAGWAQTVHGDLETPVDWMCEVTHRRAMAFGTDPKLFSHSMMYKKIAEGKTFPETKVPDEGFHSLGGLLLPSMDKAATQKSSCNKGTGCCKKEQHEPNSFQKTLPTSLIDENSSGG